MKYEPLGKYVKLTQGLAVNKGTAHFLSNERTGEFIYPLLRIVDFENEEKQVYSKYVSNRIAKSMIIDENDIVFTRVTGQCFRGYKGVLHNNLFKVELVGDDITGDYLYTVLQSEFVKNQALNYAKSSVVPDLSHEMFKSIIIPIPSIEEQKKISELFLLISNRIANAKRINTELTQMARTLYNYWFLQYEFPNDEGKPYKSSGGVMKHNDAIGGEVPEEWNVKEVGNVAIFENGDRGKNYPSGTDFVDKGIPFINGGMINDNCIDGELQYITEEKYNSLRAGKVSKGDIMITLRGSVDKCVYSPFEKAAIASALVIIRPQNEINNTYLYHYLISDYYKNLCLNYDNGSVQANLSVDVIKSFPIIVPSVEVLKQWENITKRIDEMIENNKKVIAELKAFLNTLVPWLLNGQVYIEDK